MKNLQETFRYIPPKKNKQTLLYDFYALSYMKTLEFDTGDIRSGMGRNVRGDTLRMGASVKIQDNIQEIEEKLLPYLKEHLLRAVFFAVCAEFRHILDNNNAKTLRSFFDDKFITQYVTAYTMLSGNKAGFFDLPNRKSFDRHRDDSRGYLDSFKAVKATGISATEFISQAKRAFVKLSWNSNYGGQPWANICSGWERLYSASNIDELYVAIDHVYDLQHNTDTVFNKLRSYYVNNSYGWIKDALDFKANIKSIYEIKDRVSPSIQWLLPRAMKMAGKQTLQQYSSKNNVSTKTTNQKPKANGLKSDNWDGGIWQYGTWKKGVWNGGLWKDGTWESGIWKKGVWEDGIWENGTWEDGVWENGTWKSGVWEDGIWKNGVWKKGDWKDGVWENGTWEFGIWKDGIWKNGTWEDGTWEDGTWEDGTWEFGIWKSGIWEDGTWLSGWIYDVTKKGNYESDWEWNNNYVKSPISPQEYFRGTQSSVNESYKDIVKQLFM